ncbi:hypothetical protein CPB85DRAFT_1257101 [Mucidula mucida]|nr:hypothetical protein CPB85DRAFT_1257101 [Mucidula mucida]
MYQDRHPASRFPLRGRHSQALSQESLDSDNDDDLSQSSQSSYHSALCESQSRDFGSSQSSQDSDLPFNGSQQPFRQRSDDNEVEYDPYNTTPRNESQQVPWFSVFSAYSYNTTEYQPITTFPPLNPPISACYPSRMPASDVSMMSSSGADVTRDDPALQRMIAQIVEGIVAEHIRDFNAQMERMRADIRSLSIRMTRIEYADRD